MNCACVIIIIKEKTTNIPIGKKELSIRMFEVTRVDKLAPQFPMHIFDNNKVWVGTAIDINDFVLK